jgi:ribosomal protein L14
MVQKTTRIIPADKCGVWIVRVFHLYRGYNRKVSFIGDFIKASVRKTRPEN